MLPQRPPLDWRREYLPIRQRYSVAPNIKGFLRGNVVYFDNGRGALRSADASYTVVEKGGTESKTNNGIEFNASWDNPIYSDDNLTPTVDALFGLNIIKAF